MRIVIALLLLLAGCAQPPATPPPSAVTDARLCAACHAKEAAAYKQTGMGRSFYKPTSETVTEGEYAHKLSGRSYRIRSKDGKFFMRRAESGFEGKEENVWEKEIHYVLGSGNHARTYLHRTPQNRLVELPVHWYSPGFLAMGPGYDRADHFDGRRAIGFECMACHNGYPEVARGRDSMTDDPVYPGRIAEGIDCQRCHGNGASHVQAAQAQKSKEEIRAGIVNPRRLAPDRQLEICMQCHLETTSFSLPNMLVRMERGAFSYDAREPMAAFAFHFDHAPGTGHDDKFEIASSAYRLRKSKCFTESAGKLTCLNCHNPHNAAVNIDAACAQCHTTMRATHAAKKDCASCHMPKRRTEDVVHVAMTDHKIQKPPKGNLLAAREERHEVMGTTSYQGEVVPYYPAKIENERDRELYTAVAQVAHQSNTKAGSMALAAALEKHKPRHPGFYLQLAAAQPAEASKHYEKALELQPDYGPALRAYGALLAKIGKLDRARELLEKAVATDANDGQAWHELARVHTLAGRATDAMTAARRAVAAEPENADAHNTLGLLTGDEKELREALRQQPDLAEAHGNLAAMLASRGETPRAEYHYKRSLTHPGSRFNYALFLANQKRYKEATDQALRVRELGARAADLLGNLYAAQGKWREAAQTYRELLKTEPANPRGLLGLATALGGLRDLNGAKLYLIKAAQSTDAAVRQEAEAMLREIP